MTNTNYFSFTFSLMIKTTSKKNIDQMLMSDNIQLEKS